MRTLGCALLACVLVLVLCSAGHAVKPKGKPSDGGGDSGKPDSSKPDPSKTGTAKPDVTKADVGKPDVTKTDGAKPDPTKGIVAKPDAAKPDAGTPGSATPSRVNLPAHVTTRPPTFTPGAKYKPTYIVRLTKAEVNALKAQLPQDDPGIRFYTPLLLGSPRIELDGSFFEIEAKLKTAETFDGWAALEKAANAAVDNNPHAKFGGLQVRWDAGLASPQWAAAQQAQHDRAQQQSQAFNYGNYDATFTDAALGALQSTIAGKTAAEAMAGVLANHAGFALGESHESPVSKQVLIDNMPALKAAGVDTLYIEHFRFDEHQPMLDTYLSSAGDGTMPVALAAYVDRFDREKNLRGKPNLRGVLEAARKNGMRVVAADDAIAKPTIAKTEAGWPQERAARMNFVTADVVARDAARQGKFVLLLGAKHNNTHEGGMPGVAQLLQVPAMDLVESDDNDAQPTLRIDREDRTQRAAAPVISNS